MLFDILHRQKSLFLSSPFSLPFHLTNTHINTPPPRCESIFSPPVHLPGKMEPLTKETDANSVIWIKWQKEEARRGEEEWWVPGKRARETWETEGLDGEGRHEGAGCEFRLTVWSLLWADPLPAGGHVSHMWVVWGWMEKRSCKREQWTSIIKVARWMQRHQQGSLVSMWNIHMSNTKALSPSSMNLSLVHFQVYTDVTQCHVMLLDTVLQVITWSMATQKLHICCLRHFKISCTEKSIDL